MTQPDYREKARELAYGRQIPGAVDYSLADDIAQALQEVDAAAEARGHLAGRREGIEEAAKVAERMYGPYWSKGYRTASVVIARDIRALLQGGKE